MRAGGVDRGWTTGLTSLSAVRSVPAIRAGVGLRASVGATTRYGRSVIRAVRNGQPGAGPPATAPSPRAPDRTELG